MKEDKDVRQRPEAYPKPTETDRQLKNQDEYIQLQSNREEAQVPQVQQDRSGEGYNDQGRGI